MRVIRFFVLLAIVFLACPVQAATVTYLGADGLSDGAHLVGPYRLSIDGIEYTALCYDFDHYVSPGQTWQANLYLFSDLSSAYYASTPGAAAKYEDAAWLLDQILLTPEPADRIGIQHAVWSLFSSAAPTQGSAPWLSAAAAGRAAGNPGLDLGTFRVVNSLPGANPQVQGFIVTGFPGSPVPEPATTALTCTALLAVGLARRRSH